MGMARSGVTTFETVAGAPLSCTAASPADMVAASGRIGGLVRDRYVWTSYAEGVSLSRMPPGSAEPVEPVDPGHSGDGLLRQAGALATQATRRMESEHAWFRELQPDDRSWVSMIAQGAIGALLSWYAAGAPAHPLSGEVFDSAPRSLTLAITLQQTLDLTRTAIAVVEDAVPHLVEVDERPALREAVLRYSREVAFAAAETYARAAEERGRWDARLESLVVHAVIRGEADDTFASRAAELGWEDVREVAVVAGVLPSGDSTAALRTLRQAATRLGRQSLTAAQETRMICILGSSADPYADASALADFFGPGPVVIGPRVPHLYAAGRSARSALSGVEAARAWPAAPRPVDADDLLPERALLGEQLARRRLIDRVYTPLLEHSTPLLDTVGAYLDSGTGLEATGRALFLHPNTVRYRLRRVSEVVGLDPLDPREAWVLQVSLALGRMASPDPRTLIR